MPEISYRAEVRDYIVAMLKEATGDRPAALHGSAPSCRSLVAGWTPVSGRMSRARSSASSASLVANSVRFQITPKTHSAVHDPSACLAIQQTVAHTV